MSYRNLVIIVLLLLVGGGGFAIWNANQTAPKPQPVQQTKNPQDEMVGHDVSFVVTEGELKKAKIEAKKAIYNESRTHAKLSEVHGQFFDKEGKPIVDFTAPQGEYASDTKDVTLSGGVVATSTQSLGGASSSAKPSAPAGKTQTAAKTASTGANAADKDKTGKDKKGIEMRAPQMVWSSKTDLVTATGGVELKYPQGTSVAQSCRFNLDFTKVMLEGNVTSTMMPNN